MERSSSSHASQHSGSSPPRQILRRPSSGTLTNRQATIRLGSPVTTQAYTPSTAADSPSGSSSHANALHYFAGSTPPRLGTPSRPISTAPEIASAAPTRPPSIIYGSFDSRQPIEDPEVVRRHLVTDDNVFNSSGSDGEHGGATGGPSLSNDEFSSLKLQGGDITRQVYRYVEDADMQGSSGRRGRSHSFHMLRPRPEDDTVDISNIKQIGGFRRNYIRRAEASPYGTRGNDGIDRRPLFTRNFIEFLTIHGHFAGEELEEEDEEEWGSDGFQGDEEHGQFEEDAMDFGAESSALLGRQPRTPRKHKRCRSQAPPQGTAGTSKAVLLLLKSFVGTGVLFLPKAYLNGGMVFSNLVLLFVSALSFYCFVLLIRTRLKVAGSFGDIGGTLYGPRMRLAILFSIVVSQIGFASAYIVFTSENLQAFILAISKNETHIDIKWLILLQLIIFLPLSMIRDISKLGGTALVADVFIMLGLVYLYYYNFFTLATEGVSDIVNFNNHDWTLFIGTAIFTFEGIGLLIPIQETMKHPEKFPKVLGGVMIGVTTIFVTMGALSYAAYGTATKTVVILNLPQDNKFVNGVQFLYSLAILLSTPLQLFPAIRIMENGLFTRSGKHNPYIKWQKNIFRFFTVFATAFVSWGGADDLDKFVALIGSFACIPLVYMYPPLLHMRACATTKLAKAADIALCVFGLAVMIYTTALTLQKWSDPSR